MFIKKVGMRECRRRKMTNSNGALYESKRRMGWVVEGFIVTLLETRAITKAFNNLNNIIGIKNEKRNNI